MASPSSTSSEVGRDILRTAFASMSSISTAETAQPSPPPPPPMIAASEPPRLIPIDVTPDPELPSGELVRVVLSGGLRMVVERETLEKFGAFARMDPATTVIYARGDEVEIRSALRLAREGAIDSVLKRVRNALVRAERTMRNFEIRDEALMRDLQDRIAVVSLAVLPEVAVRLETDLTRKLLLFKAIRRRARQLDLASGGTQSMQSKAQRIKIAEEALRAAVPSDSGSSSPAGANDRHLRLRLLRFALQTTYEGRSAELPPALNKLTTEVQAKIEDAVRSLGGSPEFLRPVALQRLISADRDIYCEAAGPPPHVVLVPSTAATPPATPRNKMAVTPLVRVNVGGERVFELHPIEFSAIGVFGALGGSPRRGFDVFVGDEPDRFEQVLHLSRSRGRLEPLERSDDSIVRASVKIARRYRLSNAVLERLGQWTKAHKDGVGGAANTREEIRALKLTKLLSPERGEHIVAAALAEAYLERAEQSSAGTVGDDGGRRTRRLAGKAEMNLRVALPYVLTSSAVVKSSPEQRAALDRSINMLRRALVLQGRAREAAEGLDAVVAEFSRGLAGAADDIASLVRGSKPPSTMYA